MTPGETVMKAEAVHAALAEIFRRYPIQGNPDKPWKVKGRRKVEKAREYVLKAALQGYVNSWTPAAHLAAKRIANDCRVPEKQVAAVIGLIYG